MTTRPHAVLTAHPELHPAVAHGGADIRPLHLTQCGTRLDWRSAPARGRVSYPQIRPMIFSCERLRTRQDTPGAVRTPGWEAHPPTHVSDSMT